MKPSLTPCSFSNFSWKRLRIATTGPMLTSLKVVRMALVDCDCNTRSATRARRRLMGTRCSGRPSTLVAAAAAATDGNSVFGPPVGAATGARAGLAPTATAASTSPLVTRPSLPVPGTEPEARLLSAMSLVAAGMAMPALDPLAAAAACAEAGVAETALVLAAKVLHRRPSRDDLGQFRRQIAELLCAENDPAIDNRQHRRDRSDLVFRYGEVVLIQDRKIGQVSRGDAAHFPFVAYEPRRACRPQRKRLFARQSIAGGQRLGPGH